MRRVPSPRPRRARPRATVSTYHPPPSTFSLVDCPARASVALRHPVECDAEGENRERRDHALAECIPLQALCDLVSERARAYEAADHDDRQHHDDPLVDTEHDRLARERDLDLDENLRPRRAER